MHGRLHRMYEQKDGRTNGTWCVPHVIICRQSIVLGTSLHAKQVSPKPVKRDKIHTRDLNMHRLVIYEVSIAAMLGSSIV